MGKNGMDISAFFQSKNNNNNNNKKSPRKPPSDEQPLKKRKITNLSDNNHEDQKKTSKPNTRSSRSNTEPGYVVDSSSDENAKDKSVEIMDLDDFDDDDFDDDLDVEFDEQKEIQKSKRPKISSNTGSSNKNATKKVPAKTNTPPSIPKSHNTNINASEKSIEEILATIPDAKLPEIDKETSGKAMFFKKAASTTTSSNSSVPDIPEAKPNCLGGLTIVFTGVLPNLDRDASENLAKRYGAKVTKAISGKTSLVVLGDDAGPSKVEKIKKNKIKAIDEDGFILLLKSMPADGGDSDAALKAKEKREEEERKILEQVEKEEKQAAQEAKKIKLGKQKEASNNVTQAEPSKIITDADLLWTVKHAPKDISQLCGNKGQIQKLKSWLNDWFENAKHDFKKPGKDGSGIYRACLISGPPGIGKTSAAHLIAKDLGFDVLEKNASDVRSKSLLNSNIKSVLNNTSVMGFFQHQNDKEVSTNAKRFCLIMDEVDGMSSGDHGGAGALSQFCRITKMPIILICNDKSLPKMRTFDKVTYDLAFRRPSENEVKARLMTIAHREKVKLDPTVIGQLVSATNNDIRQMINLISTVSKTQKTIGHEQTKDVSEAWKKETILKPFDITSKFLNGQIYNPSSKHTLNDKINLYFNDIDFTPLMIQENYLYTRPSDVVSPKDHLRKVAQAADDISISDSINSLIRSSEQQWSLLPFHAVMSSVKPSSEVAGSITQRINFAGWLGQNSKAMKYERLLQELQYHTKLRTFTSKKELRLDYLSLLTKKSVNPLAEKQDGGIPEVIDFMDTYYLTKEDWDTMIELEVGGSVAKSISKINTKTKSAFTRKYNSSTHPTAIYKTGNSVGGKTKSQKVDYEDVVEDDTMKDDDDDEDTSPDGVDMKKDKLIKQVNRKPKAKGKSMNKNSKK